MFEKPLQIIKYNNFSLGKNKKLIFNLGSKRKYKLHSQNLEHYLNSGLQLKKNSENFRIQTRNIFKSLY